MDFLGRKMEAEVQCSSVLRQVIAPTGGVSLSMESEVSSRGYRHLTSESFVWFRSRYWIGIMRRGFNPNYEVKMQDASRARFA